LEPDQQGQITEAFASKLNWGYISNPHAEDHNFTIGRNEKFCSSREILIPWHLENCHKSDPQIASTWHMQKMVCDSECGKTGFINSIDILEQMDKDWVDFLSKCKIVNSLKNTYDTVNGVIVKPNIFARSAIGVHRNTGEKILKLSPKSEKDSLLLYDDNSPSKNDISIFSDIKIWFENKINEFDNDENYWLNWNLGDLVIIDLSTIIHAVRGGFLSGERIFNRYWAYSDSESFFRSIDNV
jgi:alpha-ketoglutarate-dependent taurine dioxygenase